MSLALPNSAAASAAGASSYEPVLAPPAHVRDELAWELVRDEWDLLLAIGSGPTTVASAAAVLGAKVDGPSGVERRVARLVSHGLVSAVAAAEGAPAFRLVPAFYERREGMSSYLRDLVLRRLQDGAAPPLAGRAIAGIGGAEEVAEFIVEAERELFPAVVALASRPESERSQRFSLFFAVAETADGDAEQAVPYDGQGFRAELLRVLRAAATARSLDPTTRSAYLWVAEMRADPEVAVEIGELFDRFLDGARAGATTSGKLPAGARGVAAFAVLPASAATSSSKKKASAR